MIRTLKKSIVGSSTSITWNSLDFRLLYLFVRPPKDSWIPSPACFSAVNRPFPSFSFLMLLPHSLRIKERVHWTILREGSAAVKMMEWLGSQTNSSAARIISLLGLFPPSSFFSFCLTARGLSLSFTSPMLFPRSEC